MKSKIAKQGSLFLHILYRKNFIRMYSKFLDEDFDMSDLFQQCIIGVDECMKLATSCYFEQYYRNYELKIEFFPKSHAGAQVGLNKTSPCYLLSVFHLHLEFQGGFICKTETEEFFVKNHTFITSHESQHSRPDHCKVFIYRLLHLIGVGAEPHFIPNKHSKKYAFTLAFYIATKRGNLLIYFGTIYTIIVVSGFKRRADHSSCHFTSQHQLQLDMLKCLFCLTDLNSGNYGLDENEQLFIIDFMVILLS